MAVAWHVDYLAALLVIGLFIPIAGKWRVDRILARSQTSGGERLRIYFSTVASQWILVALILWRAKTHGVSWSSFGLSTGRPLAATLITFLLSLLALGHQLLSLKMLRSRPAEVEGRLAQVALRIFPGNRIESLTFLAVLLTVSFCEELLFRGFALWWFATASGSVALAILASSLLFSVAHLYQGRKGIIATFIVGVLFALARVVSQSLLPSIVAHGVIDSVAGYLLAGRIRVIRAAPVFVEHP